MVFSYQRSKWVLRRYIYIYMDLQEPIIFQRFLTYGGGPGVNFGEDPMDTLRGGGGMEAHFEDDPVPRHSR